jgi:hypothetical protein
MTLDNAKQVTLNMEQRLYVIPCGDGYTCLGFAVCKNWTLGYAAWLGVTLPSPMPHASLEAYEMYANLQYHAGERARATGQRCPLHLCEQLNGLEGKRVEVVDAYGERRRFYVGKSTGWAPCHLEIARKNSTGGPAVSGSPFKSVIVIGRKES